MKSLNLIPLTLTLSLLLSACNYSVTKAGPDGKPLPPPTTEGPAGISFNYVLENSIKTSCFPCHKSPANAMGINLETYPNALINKDAVRMAVSDRYMPDSQGVSMTEEARALLISWIDAGAPQEATGNQSPGANNPGAGSQPSPSPSPSPHENESEDPNDDSK